MFLLGIRCHNINHYLPKCGIRPTIIPMFLLRVKHGKSPMDCIYCRCRSTVHVQCNASHKTSILPWSLSVSNHNCCCKFAWDDLPSMHLKVCILFIQMYCKYLVVGFLGVLHVDCKILQCGVTVKPWGGVLRFGLVRHVPQKHTKSSSRVRYVNTKKFWKSDP